ncbi:MAG: TIGR01212 family radical SAM protein [Clostridia bacterium]|nr:TIGR01212 family radical SAM protein [Clostridia bacterium]
MVKINYINQYLKDKFGERTLKICIDGGFTCPNRDGIKGKNGCIFCSELGSGEHLDRSLSIKEQVAQAFHSIKIKRANSFILYFQNFSNTYGSVEELKTKYDEAINAFYDYSDGSKKLVGLQIATRPDCITEEIAKLLSSYKDKLYIAVELGLQTTNDDNNFLNRCYTKEDFEKAVKILNSYDIDVIAHIMVGLPTPAGRETHDDIVRTIDFINTQKIQGIKIHSCYVVKNTYLEKLYNEKKYSPISLEEYLDELTYILTHISPDLVVHRISGDAPKDILVAPEWNLHKKYVLNYIFNNFTSNN